MSQTFAAITVRDRGQKILYSWFNILRLAGVTMESALGFSVMPETAFTFANTQTSAADVTGFLFSSASYKAVDVEYNYRRKTASAEAVGIGKVRCFYRELTSAWDIAAQEEGGDESGITFTITSAGQLKYATDTLAGTSYSGASKIRATGWSA